MDNNILRFRKAYYVKRQNERAQISKLLDLLSVSKGGEKTIRNNGIKIEVGTRPTHGSYISDAKGQDVSDGIG